MAQDPAYGAQRPAGLLEIGVQPGDELLHVLRRAQRQEEATLGGGEAQFGGCGAFASSHRVQLCRDARRQASE
jgi:hypothetical protein